MGLITHNRIYVCIDASPCPVIVDLVIIGSSFSPKDALSPLSPLAPPSLPLPLYRRRLPLPTGNRPCWRHGWPRAIAPYRGPTVGPLCGRRAASGCRLNGLATVDRAHIRRSCEQMSPLASAVGLPFGMALVTVSRPLAGGLGRGLAVGGRPYMGASRGWPPLLFAVKM
ncbi:hypothetical protein GW17_00027857 [Ensete ventricosum]|nr:hypothetical protein GW17_00027857 [Ensete ventricosum]